LGIIIGENKMKRLIFFLTIIFFAAITTAQVKEINIDWKSIKNSEGKIALTEIKLWGGNLNSKYEAFKYPSDICRDSKGNYYIADSGENEIVVFDKNGKFVKKTGRYGAGPGDLSFPVSIDIDSNDNLLVAEEGNNRIQIFHNGKSYITMNPARFISTTIRVDNKNRIALKDMSLEINSPLISLYDYSKKNVGRIGAFDKDKRGTGSMGYLAKHFIYTLDKEGNYYICYPLGKRVIEKYSSDGKQTMRINYQMAAPAVEIKTKRSSRGISTSGGTGPKIVSIDADREGNIFLLVQKRTFNAEDSKYSVGMSASSSQSGASTITVEPPKARKNKFDLYALIIFNKNGGLLGMKSLDYNADKIRVINDDVFIIDAYLNSVIHQYKFSR
jgi:hypothetical protein